ncbi:hypothetical protein [Labrys neptuniae]
MSNRSDPHESDDGAVVTPLLTRFRGLTSPEHGQVAVAEFEFADGTVIRIPFASNAAASFNNALVMWLAKAQFTGAMMH